MPRKSFYLAIYPLLALLLILVSACAHKLEYEDIKAFPISMSPSKEELRTDSFTIKAGEEISIWLRVGRPSLEGRDYAILTWLLDENGETLRTLMGNFNHDLHRDHNEKGYYYQLGTAHRFEKDANVRIRYHSHGKWTPPDSGDLVIRRVKKLR